MIGLFGISELLLTLETQVRRQVIETRLTGLIPSRADVRSSVGPALRGTVIGFFLGLLPGMAVAVSSFVSYIVESGLRRKSSAPASSRESRGRKRRTTRTPTRR